jgi:hypothetical protein
MNKNLLIIGLLVVFLSFNPIVTSQILSPIADLEGTIDSDTVVYFVGNTKVSGIFQGYRIDFLVNNPLFSQIDAFPLFGSSLFEDIESVRIIDTDIVGIEPLEDLFNLNDDNFSSFTNVKIIANEGPFILGVDESNLTFDSSLDFAVSSVVDIQLQQGETIPFLTIISPSKMNILYSGESVFLFQPSENGSIAIVDSDGNLLWNKNTTNKIFLIDDKDFSFIQDSPLYLFPLTETNENVELSLTPANLEPVDLVSLTEEVTTTAQGFGDISDVSEKIEGFDDIISTISSIINGGLILVETDDIFTIDNTPQKFSNFGFARGEKFQATISPEIDSIKVKGDYKLIFLGNHFYTAQAKESENGITLPILLIFIWIAAIGLFFFSKYYIKKDTTREFDEKYTRYFLFFHIISLIIAFILLDREISFQFGSSAIDSLLGQGFSLIAVVFIVIELVMWVLGYLILAIPIYLISMQGFKAIGIGKQAKGIGKGIGAFFIWIFCAFYVKLIANIIIVSFNLGNIFQMG